MSINNQDNRTLSGLTTIRADQIELPSSRRAISVNNQYGIAGQVLQKSSDNKLNWGFVDDIEIPDNSITNSKLKDKTIENNKIKDGTIINSLIADNTITNSKLFNKTIENDKIKDGTIIGSLIASDISFTTTSNLSANQFIATGNFAQTGTATNTFNGPIQTTKLTTTNQEIEAINITDGGIINLYKYTVDGGPLTISLKGQTGEITCEDLNVNNHTGEITFNDLVCNDLECKTFEILNTDSSGFTFQLTDDTMSFSGAYTISGGSANATLKSLILSGGNAGVDTLVIAGSTDTTSDSAGNLGSIIINTGVLDVKTGLSSFRKGIDVSGSLATFNNGADYLGDGTINIVDSSSDLFVRFAPSIKKMSNSGVYNSNRVGVKPVPVNNTYTEWGLDLETTNTHAHIGGNLIVDGVIYGAVVGAITEEEVDCQRINIRTATPPLAGITGIDLGSGSVITNDISGSNELNIVADTGDITCRNIICNTLSSGGNTELGTDAGSTVTVGATGSNQTFNVEAQYTEIGSTTGASSTITTTIRGGTTTINGEKLIINNVPASSPAAGTSLEGGAGQAADNIYRNNVRYFNLDGQHISHTLAGTIQNFVILRANAERTITIAKQVGFTNTSTVFTLPSTYFFENKTAHTSVAKLDFDLFFRHKKGVPDLYVRVDSTSAGATPYNSAFLKPSILVNTAFGGTGNEIRVTHSYFIVGLIPGTSYSFYPKFADTTSGSAIGTLKYGGAFGMMSLKLTWLEAYLGVVGDPYDPSSGI